LRALLQHRIQLVRLRTLLRNRIHAVLADHGHDRPSGYWSGPSRSWLAFLDLPAVSAEVIGDALALIDALESVTDRLDVEIRGHARSDPRVKVLTALPGVGPFTALVLLAEIGKITRFGSARKLASWAGLTPTVRWSDRMGPSRAHLQAGLAHANPQGGCSSLPIIGRRSPTSSSFVLARVFRRGAAGAPA
jgi:transposase